MGIVQEFAKDALEMLFHDGRSKRARAAKLRQRRRIAFATDAELLAIAGLHAVNAEERFRELQTVRSMFLKDFSN